MRDLQAGPAVAPLTGRRALLAAVVAGAVVAADQLTKSWALRALDDGPVHVVWTLQLALSINSGAAFGLGRGLGPLLVVAGIALLVSLLVLGRSVLARLPGALALGLVAGGAVGNLLDRLLRDLGGVVDFIDFQWWPVFNVADIAITVGAGLLVLVGWEGGEEA